MDRIMPARAAEKLLRRAPLPVDPRRGIAIKRDVHVFEVETDAETFAAAFRAVVTDPESTFGLIRVKRPAARMGREFQVGERFQGCFSIERAVLGLPERGALRLLRGALGAFLRLRPAAWLVSKIEDAMLSNYAEILEIVLEPDPAGDPVGGGARRLKYGYLDGTPIAGSSTFLIEPLGPDRCRFTQVFEFQEVNRIALNTFERFGLKYHDQVVHMQVHKAAARAGARVISGTIPLAYAEAK